MSTHPHNMHRKKHSTTNNTTYDHIHMDMDTAWITKSYMDSYGAPYPTNNTTRTNTHCATHTGHNEDNPHTHGLNPNTWVPSPVRPPSPQRHILMGSHRNCKAQYPVWLKQAARGTRKSDMKRR